MKEFNFKPTEWALNNKVTIFVITTLMIFAGIIAYNNIPKEQFPELVIPTVYIGTVYAGTSPEDIENLITRQIEKKLKSVSGVKKITSKSIQDFSAITVEFNTNIDPIVAKRRTQDAVDNAMSDLPTDLDQDPNVQEIDFSEFPIQSINVSGPYDLDQIKKYAEEIQDAAEQLRQITRVDMIGDLEKEVQINVDIYKMQLAGISFSDISSSIKNENINLAGGNINVGKLERTIRVVGEFKDVRELENIIIRGSQANSLYLRDFATIQFTDKDRRSFARLNRNPVIALNVIKRSGENLLEAAAELEAIIEKLQKTKFPKDLEVVVTNDLSVNTKTSINELINSVIIGFILVTVVLLFFMGIRNAVFVGLAVPLSSFLSFMILPSLNFTFNIIVTFSFLLGLGIVVDNAIVVIENTYRLHTKEGYDIKRAARVAAGEVFGPVLAGTITTVAPFFPLLFWPGIIGDFMFYLPAVLIIVLTASLFVAFIINPVFALQFMDNGKVKVENNKSLFINSAIFAGISILLHLLASGAESDGLRFIANLIIWGIIIAFTNKFVLVPFVITPFQEKLLPFLMDLYRKILSTIIVKRRPFLVLLTTVFVLFISIFIMGLLSPKVDFFPDPDPNSANVYIELPLGTRAVVTDSITNIIENRVFKIVGENNPLVKSVQSNVGIGAGDPMDPDRNPKTQQGKVTVSFVEFGKRNGASTWEILNAIRDDIKGLAGVSIKVEKEQAGPPTGKPVNIEILGDDLIKLIDISERFRSLIVDSSGIEGIENLKSDLELNKPEIIVKVNREKANKEGISSIQVASAIRTALYGQEVDKFTIGEDDYDIMLRLDENLRHDISSLMNLRLTFREATGDFRQVPIASIATIEYAKSYGGINRKNNNRVVTLSSNVIEGFNANEIVASIQKLANKFDLPEGYEIKFTGEQEDQAETTNFLSLAFGISIMLVVLTLVIMFNSVVKPIIILSTILFSLIGVFLGIALSGMDVVIVMTGVGIISLAGIVVNNGILLIDFTDELMRRNIRTRIAIIEGGAVRFTPVILTASSTMLGLVPLASGMNIDFYTLLTEWNPQINFYGNDNTAFFAPLSWAIIFGLSFSTILTLFVVPSMYMIQYNIKLKYKFFRNRKFSIPVSIFKMLFSRLPKIA